MRTHLTPKLEIIELSLTHLQILKVSNERKLIWTDMICLNGKANNLCDSSKALQKIDRNKCCIQKLNEVENDFKWGIKFYWLEINKWIRAKNFSDANNQRSYFDEEDMKDICFGLEREFKNQWRLKTLSTLLLSYRILVIK